MKQTRNRLLLRNLDPQTDCLCYSKINLELIPHTYTPLFEIANFSTHIWIDKILEILMINLTETLVFFLKRKEDDIPLRYYTDIPALREWVIRLGHMSPTG